MDADQRPGGRCPLCRAPAVQAYRPFCSKRCADVDLHRWLKGTYAIATSEAEDTQAAATDGDALEAGGGRKLL